MPYVYAVSRGGANYTCSATPNTEDAFWAFQQTTRNHFLNQLLSVGKGAALTSLSSIVIRMKRWTTAGTGGTALTPSPTRRDMPAAALVVKDNQSALTPGTVSGVFQLVIGHGAAGPGGWTARDDSSKKMLEAGSADEFTFYSASGTASLTFEPYAEIEE